MSNLHIARSAVVMPALALAALVMVSACEPIDTAPLREIEETMSAARNSADTINTRSGDVQRALEDPVGALRTATLGATFTKTATAEPNIFVLTDLQTGCQWLATYGADGEASSLAARTEPTADGVRQRCISVGGSGGDSGDNPSMQAEG